MEKYVDPESWQAMTPAKEGSWWPDLAAWLAQRSGKRTAPPTLSAPEQGYPALGDAPGTYVLAS